MSLTLNGHQHNFECVGEPCIDPFKSQSFSLTPLSLILFPSLQNSWSIKPQPI